MNTTPTAPAPDQFDAVRHAHEFTDQATAHMREQSAAAGLPVTCSKGCFACCMEPVLATREEALYLIAALSPEQRALATEKTRVWAVKAKNSGMLAEPWPHVYFYRMFKLWCPLLHEGLCTAYDRRPVGCRLHLVTGKPADCGDNNRRLSQQFVSSPEIADACTCALGEGISKNLGVWLAEFLCGIHLETAGVFEAKADGDDLLIGLSEDFRKVTGGTTRGLIKLLRSALDPMDSGFFRLAVVK